jgi:hypothetical protein
VKLIRLRRFNQRIYLFIQTFKQAGKELISFAMMFSIVVFSFICLFYLLFNSKIWSCSSLFQMMLMNFDAHQLSGAAAFFGSFCFSIFILIVVFVCMLMLLSIINKMFRQTRENSHADQQM